MLTFAEFLSKRRAALGMSMTELAVHLSVTPQYISLLEAGKCNPSRKLQERCAKFFGEDIEYIRFLAQPMSRTQKEILLRTPSALPFLAKQSKPVAVASEGRSGVRSDSEDALLQELFFRSDSEDAPREFYTHLISELLDTPNGSPRFSPKAQAWAEYFQARLVARSEGANAALPIYEGVYHRLRANDAYPDVLRLRAGWNLAETAYATGETELAAITFESVAETARRADETDKTVEAYERAANAYQELGQVNDLLAMLERATTAEDIPAPIKARLLVRRGELELNLGNAEAAFDAIQQAVKIWRLRSLDILNKTRQLVSTQILGLHALMELEDETQARQWLGRIRSTLTRVTGEDMPDGVKNRFVAESDLESTALMVREGRWNHAWKNLSELQQPRNGLSFENPTDETLFHARIGLLKARAALGLSRPAQAAELAREILAIPPLDDPIQQMGRMLLIRWNAGNILAEAGERESARQTGERLAAELDADRYDSASLRNFCKTPQIQRIRAMIVEKS